jgi:hypothetical protein
MKTLGWIALLVIGYFLTTRLALTLDLNAYGMFAFVFVPIYLLWSWVRDKRA